MFFIKLILSFFFSLIILGFLRLYFLMLKVVKNFLIGLLKSFCFLWRRIIFLVSFMMRFMLWVISSILWLFLWRECIILIIFFFVFVLRLVVGLLRIRYFGFIVRMQVIVNFCFLLLLREQGVLFLKFLSFIDFSVYFIFFLIFFLFRLRFFGLKVILLKIVFLKNMCFGFWKMQLMSLLSLVMVCFFVLRLFMRIFFLEGLRRLLKCFVSVVFLFLFGLMSVIIFCFILKFMFFRIFFLLQVK